MEMITTIIYITTAAEDASERLPATNGASGLSDVVIPVLSD